ncbi:MAG: dihydrofolate reductase [Proteobacteria bacterium]|nr:MAG: dihydrofolate reductase [Pseudomonadota bacterium]PIE64931.1 MAG: dihydrofolate reductase [Desulfobacterales bacterium]
MIAAIAANRAIGKNGELPWYLPSDLQHFKKTTMDFPVLMGRNTFDSIGKPLPGRINIVLTRDQSRTFPGCRCFYTIQQAVAFCKQFSKVFIIGGGDIFKTFLPCTDTIILTVLKRDVAGDTFFPEIDPRVFRKVETTSYHIEEPYDIVRFERING